ncbi:MAG: hypothetical protein JG774_1202 [Desulfomicrobiaceae bacterium]|nr:hypothetical protein [Desulfomicrobiaceae bacterium]MDI3492872.1 hypothetical protein [Desulfomicrobiaceae bacterium]
MHIDHPKRTISLAFRTILATDVLFRVPVPGQPGWSGPRKRSYPQPQKKYPQADHHRSNPKLMAS